MSNGTMEGTFTVPVKVSVCGDDGGGNCGVRIQVGLPTVIVVFLLLNKSLRMAVPVLL
jgi:hypothetical protein